MRALDMLALDMPVARIKLGKVIGITARAISWDIHRDSAPGHLCPYCWEIIAGKTHPYRAPTWDHVVPVSRGGPDTKANILVVCRRCNGDKGNRNPIEWLGVLRYSKDHRASKLARFVEIISADWSEADRAAAADIADEWERQAAAQQSHLAETLRSALTDPKPGIVPGATVHYSATTADSAVLARVAAIMSEHRIERQLWSFLPPCSVRITVAGRGRPVQMTYAGDDQFRRTLAMVLTNTNPKQIEAAE